MVLLGLEMFWKLGVCHLNLKKFFSQKGEKEGGPKIWTPPIGTY